MKYIGRLILILFLPMAACGQNLLSPIHNYKIFDYNAAGKNWGLAVDESGELFVANNKGLLHFNGEVWNLYKLPNEINNEFEKAANEKVGRAFDQFDKLRGIKLE